MQRRKLFTAVAAALTIGSQAHATLEERTDEVAPTFGVRESAIAIGEHRLDPLRAHHRHELGSQ